MLTVVTLFATKADGMSYYDFVIRKDNKFLRKFYDREVLAESDSLKCLENFDVTFQKFVQVFVLSQSYCSSTSNIDCIEHIGVEDFCGECGDDCETFAEIFDEIEKVEIKNSYEKYSQKRLWQIIAFVYVNIMKFPSTKYLISNIVTKKFGSVNTIIEAKIHLHQSHITDEIYGCADSFCNISSLRV